MTEHENAVRIRNMLESFGRGDLESVGEHFAPDAVWELPGRSDVAGTYKGPEEILGFLAKAFELSGGTLALEPLAVMGSDWGAVHVQRVTANRNGRTLDCVEVIAHEIVDGRIRHSYHRPDQYAIDGFFSG